MTPPKVNSTTKTDMNNSEVNEVWDIELKRMIIRMIKDIKEDMNKCLNELQENTNSWMK
jgi:hypothetical protein